MTVPANGTAALLAGGALLSGATLLATGVNYGLNLLLATRLDPAAFGDANLAMSLVLVAGVAAATLQIATATLVARRPADHHAAVRALSRLAIGGGAVPALAMAALAAPLASVLHTSTPWMFALLALSLPVFLVQAVHRGVLQGTRRISRLALSYAIEAAVRFAATLVLVAAGLGVVGVCAGIGLALLASALVTRSRSRGPRAGTVPWAELRTTIGTALVLLTAQVVFLNTDLVLAKALLAPAAAGAYAAAALLGRGVFFLCWSVAQSILPAVASQTSAAEHDRRPARTVLATVATAAVAADLAIVFVSDRLAAALPDGYGAAPQLVLPQAVAGSLFALAAVIGALDLARGQRRGPWLLVLAAAAQVAAAPLASSPQSVTALHALGAALALSLTAGAAAARRPRARRTPLPVPRPEPLRSAP